MRWAAELWERSRSFLFRSREELELDEELRFHLERETEKNLRAGMSPEEARRQAAIAFGGVEKHKEEVREARGLGWIAILVGDLRYALRNLRRYPSFSVALILTLALGIGASAAMFSIVDALLLRPLPYHQPDELVDIWAFSEQRGRQSYVDWDAAQVWAEQPEIFQGVMGSVRESVLFTQGPEPRTITGEGVTPNFEEILGVYPVLGRGLSEQDAALTAPPVALLDYTFWRSAFGGDPDAIGKSIELDGQRHQIVGVMPEGFKFPEYSTTEVWIPLGSDGSFLGRATGRISFLGRVRGGPLKLLQDKADAVALALAEEQPRETGWSIQLSRLSESRAGNSELRRAVWFLAGAVALLLLSAAVNGTSLLLVRGWSRARELAVRVAVGASRRRILGQLMTEGMVVAVASGIAATMVALIALQALRGIIPDSITFWAPHAIQMEWRALSFTFAIAAATGMVVAWVPALRATRVGSAAAQGGLTQYATRTPAKSRLRRALIVGEVMLSVILLIGAGLLINSFMRLVRVDPGFRMENLAVMTLSLSSASYPSSTDRAAFLGQLEERLEAIPGVEGVAVNGGVPPANGLYTAVELEAEGEPPLQSEQPQILPFGSIPPDFFEVLEVPIVLGRALTAADAGTDHVIIDRSLARFLWNGANPVGRRFRYDSQSDWLTVVGVVEDLRMVGPDDRSGRFEILYPLAPDQAPAYVPLAIRTTGDPEPLLRSFRAAVHELNPRQPIEELRPAHELYAATIDMPRFLLVLMSILAGLALLLATIGIYGVLAFGVAQRRRELGIRIALGAKMGQVRGEVLREGVLLAAVGAVAGTVIALGLSRFVQSILYELSPTDPGTIATVVLVSLTAAAAASYWPARRATAVDPIEVLRAE